MLGFVPGIPHVQLKPQIVLVAILPPLLYGAGFFTSLRDLRTNARPLALLSIGLVLTTTLSVAVVCHAFVAGHDVARVLRRRGDRGADRRGCRDGDRLTTRAAASDRGAARRREPDQRCHGARRLQVRRRHSADRKLLALGSLLALRRRRARWDRDRPRGRLRAAPGQAAARPLADRDCDRSLLGLLRLPAGRGGGRLRGTRSGHGQHLRRLVYARADERADAAPGRRGLGDPDVHAECAAVRPDRASAAAGSSTTSRGTHPSPSSPTERSSASR